MVRSTIWTAVGTMGLVAALSGAGVAAAEECGCAPRSSHAVEALSSYRSAFAGRVVSVREEGADRTVSFQVFRAWKGPRGKTLEVKTPAGACGVDFTQGADYVVFATATKDAKDTLRTDTCAPTAGLGQSARAVRQLDLNSGYGSNPLRVPAAAATEEARQH